MKKNKFYVVWKGQKTGIFNSWEACKKNIQGISGAKYKSFLDKKTAETAFGENYENYIGKKIKTTTIQNVNQYEKPNLYSICVDAACSGNPGKMEYRGVFGETKTLIFYRKFDHATNNIGEFLAIVHALAFCKKNKDTKFKEMLIYSDSKHAISWVKQKKCKTKLKSSEKNKMLFEVIKRAEHWLKENDFSNPIKKWHTKVWGEIPADFGRKK